MVEKVFAIWPNNRRHKHLFSCFFGWVEGGDSTYPTLPYSLFSPVVVSYKVYEIILFDQKGSEIFLIFCQIWKSISSSSQEFGGLEHWASKGAFKEPSHIQNGVCPISLLAKKRIFARMTAGVFSISAGSAAIFRDRPAFAGHRNLFLIQRFSNGRISDLRNMTCTNFRCPIYSRSGRRRTPGRTSGGTRPSVGRPGCQAGVDRFINYRPKFGRRPPLYRPDFARLPLVYWRAPGDFWSLVFEGHRPSPVQNVTGYIYISSKKYARLPGEFELRRRSGDLQFRPEIVGYICDVGIIITFVGQARFYGGGGALGAQAPPPPKKKLLKPPKILTI